VESFARIMRMLKSVGLSIGVLVILVLIFIGRLWWEAGHPIRPKDWPPDSVWLEAPHTWPGLLLLGYWVGCSVDTEKNVDRCRFADNRGKVVHEDDYTTCDGKPAIPNQELLLRPGQQSFAFIFLRDGRVMVSQDLCDARNGKPFRQ
jgi:hypothetical protein